MNKDGIVKIGSYIKEHDILVGKLTPCEEDSSPETKLLRALYGHKGENFRDTSLRVHSTKDELLTSCNFHSFNNEMNLLIYIM